MIKKTCVQCGKEFVITDSEIKFYKSKHLSFPKRCKECRKQNKNRKGSDRNKSSDKKETVPANSKPDKNKYNKSTREAQSSSRPKSDTHVAAAKHTQEQPKSKIKYVIAVLTLALVALASIFVYQSSNPAEAGADKGTHDTEITYSFRNETYASDHFKKHGDEFNYDTLSEYVDGANDVINSSESLHKEEADDGDQIYYLEDSNEIVFLSDDGYIRTYFKPSDGINYYERQ